MTRQPRTTDGRPQSVTSPEQRRRFRSRVEQPALEPLVGVGHGDRRTNGNEPSSPHALASEAHLSVRRAALRVTSLDRHSKVLGRDQTGSRLTWLPLGVLRSPPEGCSPGSAGRGNLIRRHRESGHSGPESLEAEPRLSTLPPRQTGLTRDPCKDPAYGPETFAGSSLCGVVSRVDTWCAPQRPAIPASSPTSLLLGAWRGAVEHTGTHAL